MRPAAARMSPRKSSYTPANGSSRFASSVRSASSYCFGVELDLGEAHARDLLQLVFAAPVEHALQLRRRACRVAGIEQELRDEQRARAARNRCRRISPRAAPTASFAFATSFALRRGVDGGDTGPTACVRLVGPATSASPAPRGCRARRRARHRNEVAPLVPPGLEVVHLFLLFEIVDCHARLSVGWPALRPGDVSVVRPERRRRRRRRPRPARRRRAAASR